LLLLVQDQFYWVLRTQQEVWPGLPWVHIWDYTKLNLICLSQLSRSCCTLLLLVQDQLHCVLTHLAVVAGG